MKKKRKSKWTIRNNYVTLGNVPQVLCPRCKKLVDEDTECPFCGDNVGHYPESEE